MGGGGLWKGNLAIACEKEGRCATEEKQSLLAVAMLV